MKVDVIIPSYKPDEKLNKICEMLSGQTVQVNKIIVVNTEEKYFDRTLTDKYENLFVYHINKDEFDHGKTRNAGVAHSDAECFVMMTQDAVPCDNKLIESLVEALNEEDGIKAAYARQMATEDSSISEKFTRQFNYPDKETVKSEQDIKTLGIKAFFCSNVCCAYKRDAFDELGGFINEAVFNEDMVYAHKLLVNGYKIKYEPKAKVYHTHEYTGMQQYRRNFDLAVSQAMHPEVFEGISSESEGVRYVLNAFKYFVKNKKPLHIIPFGIKCCYKLIGFRKGKNFYNMSKEAVLKAASNKEFFVKYYAKENLGD